MFRSSYRATTTSVDGDAELKNLNEPLLDDENDEIHIQQPTFIDATSTSYVPPSLQPTICSINSNEETHVTIEIPQQQEDGTDNPHNNPHDDPSPSAQSPTPSPHSGVKTKKSLKKRKKLGPPLTIKEKQIMTRDIALLGSCRALAIIFTLISIICQTLIFIWHVKTHHGLKEIKELLSPSIRLLALYSICRLTGKYQRIIIKRLSKKYKVICQEVAASWLYRAGVQYGEQILFAILTFGFSLLNMLYHLTSRPSHYELWHVLVQYAIPVAIDLVILIPIHFYIQHTRIHYIAKHSDTN